MGVLVTFLVTVPLGIISLTNTANAGTKARQLFNGKDLQGWQQLGPGSFIVDHGLMRTEGGMGMLWYPGEKFGDAKLRVVFKMTGKEPDSGLFIRIPKPPLDPWMAINTGYEIEIGEWPNEYGRTGVIYSFTKALAHAAKSRGQWNTMEVTLKGPRILVRLNGVKVTDYREGDPIPIRTADSGLPTAGSRPEAGFIGLQNHPGGAVYFKEVSVQPL